MVGIKLRSGKLSEFVATGAQGAPVYASADQLRAAIRRHLGQESADFFAIAKPFDTGNEIQWYAPNRGTVIPWSCATPEEKTSAKAMLVEARAKILERSAALLTNENPEQQLFGKLLEKSVRIPDDTHIYIVGGQPVMTFWGFDSPNAPAGIDIITNLVTIPNVPKAEITAPVIETIHEEPERRRSFLMWLIPLLLLFLLLLWFLHSCAQKPITLTANAERTALHNNTSVIENGIIRDHITSNTSHNVKRNINHTGNRNINSTNINENAALEETLMHDSTEATQQEFEGMETAPIADDAALENPLEGEGELQNEPTAPTASDTPPTADDNAAMQEETASAEQQPAQAQTQGQTQPNTRAQPLQIPTTALENGSTEFLNGQWASHTGLTDSKTGKPIKVEYDINEGAGKARIKRPDGSICNGDVSTSIENGQLVIAGQNSIRCPDGVTYDTSDVVCTNGADGSATSCKGVNHSGGTYPVKLRKSE